MLLRYSFALGALAAGALPATAAEMTVQVEIPRLNVAEYHRPYVAVWVERADKSVAANLALWYQQKKSDKNEEGTKWLKDMRQWWRRSGRELTLPVDGVSSATRPAGQHAMRFTEGAGPLGTLPAGSYALVVEAAREVGGRELVSVPFQWPPTAATQAQARGSDELGAIGLELKP